MANPTTWAELKTSLTTRMIRDDLADVVAEHISTAECWMQREIFGPEREVSTTLTVTDGVATLPDDFGGVKLVYVDGTSDTVLEHVTPSELRELYPTANTGTPLHFAIEGETMLFGPVPSSGLVIKLQYVEGIPALGDSQATNWLLTDHPDLYVYASLAELCEYTRDFIEADRHRAKAAIIADSVQRSFRRRKTNSGPLAASARGDQILSFVR